MEMDKSVFSESELLSILPCKAEIQNKFSNRFSDKIGEIFDNTVTNLYCDPKYVAYTDDLPGEQFHVHSLLTENECTNSSNCIWTCDYCDKRYSCRQDLAEHTRNHTGSDLPCPLCEKRFSNQSKLNAHFKTHTKQRNHFCVYCDKSFTDHGTLVEHTKLHTGQKNHKCQFCEKTFVQKGVYLAHLKLHTGLNLWSCEYCGKKFNRKSSLMLHIRKHTGDVLSCHLCETKFTVRSKLLSHIKHHGGIKEYKCDVCDRSYVEKNSLRQHYQIHTQGKINCQDCNKSFTKKSSLDRHMLLHGGKKPFECPICQRQFIQLVHMRTHLTKQHEQSPLSLPLFLCHYCGKSYQHKQSLSIHIRSHEDSYIDDQQVNHKNLLEMGDDLNTNVESPSVQGPLDTNCEVSLEAVNEDNVSIYSDQLYCENSLELPVQNSSEIACSGAEESKFLISWDPETQLSELISILGDLSGISLDIRGKPPSIDSIRPLLLKSIRDQSADQRDNEVDHESVIEDNAVNSCNEEDLDSESGNCCCVCDLQFKSKKELDSHLKNHYKDNTIICSYCSKAFKSVSRLKLHIVSHKECFSHRCHICGRIYRYKHSLTQHMSLHTGLKPFKCSYSGCHKKFTKKVSLQRHTTTHTGVRAFSCSHCKRSFAQKSQLIIHTRIHTGERPFLCTYCGKRFSRRDSLMIHLRTHTLKHFLTAETFVLQNGTNVSD